MEQQAEQQANNNNEASQEAEQEASQEAGQEAGQEASQEAQDEAQGDPEIAAFVDRAWARAKDVMLSIDNKGVHADPQGAVQLAVLAWQIVRGLCDEQGLAVVAKGGVIQGVASVEISPAPAEL